MAGSHHTFDLRTSAVTTDQKPLFWRESFTLPARATAVREARHRLGAGLRTHGVCDDGDAALVLSELFTNALVHTSSAEIACQVWATTERLYLAVADQGRESTEPSMSVPEDDAPSGRGLMLVDAVTDQWGVLPMTDGRVVWAAVPLLAAEAA